MSTRFKNFSFCLLVIFFTYFCIRPEDIVKSVKNQYECVIPDYESTKTSPVHFNLTECFGFKDDTFREGQIRFQGALRVDEAGLYDNLFQTADFNSGIRVELNGNHALGVLMYTHKRFDPLIFHYVKSFPFGKPLEFDLKVNSDLNLVELKHGENEFQSKSELSFSPQIGNFILGQGFDSTRKLNGQFKNFRATYTSYDYFLGINPKWARSLWVVTFFFLTLISVRFFLRIFND